MDSVAVEEPVDVALEDEVPVVEEAVAAEDVVVAAGEAERLL